jgi:hypothetical protein
MAADDYKVEVEGLKEMRRALEAAAPGLREQIKQANISVAEHVAESARSRASAMGGVAAKAAPSIRANRTNAYAAVSGGGARYPYFYGAEFGSLKYKQFKGWRGNQWTPWGDSGVGYFLHPTIRDQRQQIIDTYNAALTKAVKEAFPN